MLAEIACSSSIDALGRHAHTHNPQATDELTENPIPPHPPAQAAFDRGVWASAGFGRLGSSVVAYAHVRRRLRTSSSDSSSKGRSNPSSRSSRGMEDDPEIELDEINHEIYSDIRQNDQAAVQ